MKLPKGFKLNEGSARHTHALKLLKSMYGLKQVGRFCNQHLNQGLIELGYKQSKLDQCLYYRNGIMMVIYTGDCIMAGNDTNRIDMAIADITA